MSILKCHCVWLWHYYSYSLLFIIDIDDTFVYYCGISYFCLIIYLVLIHALYGIFHLCVIPIYYFVLLNLICYNVLFHWYSCRDDALGILIPSVKSDVLKSYLMIPWWYITFDSHSVDIRKVRHLHLFCSVVVLTLTIDDDDHAHDIVPLMLMSIVVPLIFPGTFLIYCLLTVLWCDLWWPFVWYGVLHSLSAMWRLTCSSNAGGKHCH